jgi:hypothetical protein
VFTVPEKLFCGHCEGYLLCCGHFRGLPKPASEFEVSAITVSSEFALLAHLLDFGRPACSKELFEQMRLRA